MNRNEKKFVETVWQYYEEHGRHDLPWRKKSHLKPYNILVSEVMLQQTQVDRVVPKYQSFMKRWPTARQLAVAPLGEVLGAWQGLGYNRRAKMLHECARTIVTDYKNRWPQTEGELQELPGVGPYTAGAVMAFAYNKPIVLVETNVRTVFLHHFFANRTDVTDTEILHLIAQLNVHIHPREWYWALMDYGAFIKRTYGNPNSKSAHYTKQSAFVGSDRQIRGAILRTLVAAGRSLSRTALHDTLSQFEDIRIDAQLLQLTREGLLTQVRGRYCLPA